MWDDLLGWLRTNREMLAMAGALVGFLLWEMRKKRLEIKKLHLEIRKLSEETRIYRPTPEEIDRIMSETAGIATRKLGLFGGQDPLEEFGIALHHFLTHLAAYQGIPSASVQVANERLYAGMHHQPDPYGADFKEVRFPDPIGVLRSWKDLRSEATRRLSRQTVEGIDRLLSRFESGEARITSAWN